MATIVFPHFDEKRIRKKNGEKKMCAILDKVWAYR